MSECVRVITEIKTEPATLNEYADDLHAILETGDVEMRQRVAELLREIASPYPASHDEYLRDICSLLESGEVTAPQQIAELRHEEAFPYPSRSIVASHTDLLEIALHDDDPEVRRFGAIATALVANVQPETVAGFVEELVDAFSLLHPIEQGIVLRGVGEIGWKTDTSLKQYDSWFADLLRNGELLLPEEVAANIGNVARERPNDYPATIEALVAVLKEDDPNGITSETRESAVVAIVLIAQEDLSTLPDPDQIFNILIDQYKYNFIDNEKIYKSIKLFRRILHEQGVSV